MATVGTFEILKVNLPLFEEKMAKLARRGEKLGVPVTFRIVREYDVKKEKIAMVRGEPKKVTYYVPWLSVEITTDMVVISGWSPVATVEMLGDKPLFYSWPGREVPVEFRETTVTRCDHCHAPRHRKNVYLISNDETGEVQQVGSTCVRDYIGWDPSKIARMCEFLQCLDGGSDGDLDESFWGFGGGSIWPMDLHRFLTATAMMIRKYGWMSNGRAKQDDHTVSTSDAAVSWFCNPPEMSKPMPTQEDQDLATQAIDIVSTIEGSSDYLWNLKTCISAGVVTLRATGIVASAIALAMREIEKEIKRQKRLENGCRGFFGSPKKRETFELTVVGSKRIETRFGVTCLQTFLDNDGREAVWWDSGNHNLEIGKLYKVVGTVKAHAEYNGEDQTTLTRCKMVRV